MPLIERLAGELGALVSVDTYKPAVARAAIAAGASIVNDVSGLRDPELAAVCAQTGAALVLMHTRAAPRERLQDPDLYEDVDRGGAGFPARADRAGARRGRGARAADRRSRPGLREDAGADDRAARAKSARLHELGRPLLMAISRKDFIGALTGRAPHERLAGTLAALAHGVDAGRAHLPRPRRGRGVGLPRRAGRALRASTSPAGISRSPRNCAMSGPTAAAAARLTQSNGCPPLSNAAGRQPPTHTKREKNTWHSARPLRAGGKPSGRPARDRRSARTGRLQASAQGRPDRRDPR